MPARSLYKSVLLKLSGEHLASGDEGGISSESCRHLADEIGEVMSLGARVGVVVGAGNLWRGNRGRGKSFERATSDHMGMLATLMNALALAQSFRECGSRATVLSRLGPHALAEPFSLTRLGELLERKEVVIFAGGTGHPYFTTDTAAALMALEMRAEVLLKATTVDGIYDRDPRRFKGAKRYSRISFDSALAKNLGVMDSAALSLCREGDLAIRIFPFSAPRALFRAMTDSQFGSAVTSKIGDE